MDGLLLCDARGRSASERPDVKSFHDANESWRRVSCLRLILLAQINIIDQCITPSDTNSTGLNTMPYQPQLQSRFLALPRELRDLIYEYAFSASTVRVGPWYQRKGRGVHFMLRAPNSKKVTTRNAGLILACRQLYGETLLLYYRHTEFIACGYGCIRDWLKILRPQVIAAIESVVREENIPWSLEEEPGILVRYLGSNGKFLKKGVITMRF